jgi:hypothetical protein
MAPEISGYSSLSTTRSSMAPPCCLVCVHSSSSIQISQVPFSPSPRWTRAGRARRQCCPTVSDPSMPKTPPRSPSIPSGLRSLKLEYPDISGAILALAELFAPTLKNLELRLRKASMLPDSVRSVNAENSSTKPVDSFGFATEKNWLLFPALTHLRYLPDSVAPYVARRPGEPKIKKLVRNQAWVERRSGHTRPCWQAQFRSVLVNRADEVVNRRGPLASISDHLFPALTHLRYLPDSVAPYVARRPGQCCPTVSDPSMPKTPPRSPSIPSALRPKKTGYSLTRRVRRAVRWHHRAASFAFTQARVSRYLRCHSVVLVE